MKSGWPLTSPQGLLPGGRRAADPDDEKTVDLQTFVGRKPEEIEWALSYSEQRLRTRRSECIQA